MKEQVYALLQAIPEGKVATYSQLAAQLGNPNLARAVGNWLHQNPDPSRFPCHRVVNARGQVSPAYAFGGAAAQRRRLEEEGIRFQADGSIDLAVYAMTQFPASAENATARP